MMSNNTLNDNTSYYINGKSCTKKQFYAAVYADNLPEGYGEATIDGTNVCDNGPSQYHQFDDDADSCIARRLQSLTANNCWHAGQLVEICKEWGYLIPPTSPDADDTYWLAQTRQMFCVDNDAAGHLVLNPVF